LSAASGHPSARHQTIPARLSELLKVDAAADADEKPDAERLTSTEKRTSRSCGGAIGSWSWRMTFSSARRPYEPAEEAFALPTQSNPSWEAISDSS
jgi:hypothetical protein